MEEPPVLVHRIGEDRAIAIVTLNRPMQRNALNQPLVAALAAAFRDLQADESVRVAVLTGAGTAFSAGIDLSAPPNALQQASEDPEDWAANPVRAMEAFSRPIIGAINGPAVTGGFELALACDVLVGSPAASFRDTHGQVGVVPCWGLSQRLTRAVGPVRARLASLTAASITASRALAWGLLAEVSDGDGGVLPLALSIASRILILQPAVVEAYLATLRDGAALPLGEALTLERSRARAQYRALGQATIADGAARTLRARL